MTENYTDQYIEQTFFLWYKGGRKISQKFANSLPEEAGKRPSFKTIEKWRDGNGWIERADSLDAELSNTLQREFIDERVKMYQEQLVVGNALVEKGKTFIENHPIEEMSDALKAISLGIEIQRVSVGQIALGQKILSMTDDQLTKELNKLLSPMKPDSEFIDAEVDEEEETSSD